MNLFFELLLTLLPIFVLLEVLWFGIIARKFYLKRIKKVVSAPPKLSFMFLFYLLYVVALIILVIIPAGESRSWVNVLFPSVLLGLLFYTGYNLANLSIFNSWPKGVLFVDLFWGILNTALICSIGFYFCQIFA